MINVSAFDDGGKLREEDRKGVLSRGNRSV